MSRRRRLSSRILTRQAVDDVERGETDSDWAPLKEAARKIAFAEDLFVFDGYAAAWIQGIREGSGNPPEETRTAHDG